MRYFTGLLVLSSVAALIEARNETTPHNLASKPLTQERYQDNEHRLIYDLFRGYSSEVRPVLNYTNPVQVKLDLAYSQLVELNGKSQILTSKVWIRQQWTNPFLTWNPSDYGGINFINVDPKLVWKPDLILYNSIQRNSGEMYNFNTKVVMTNDGVAKWYAPTEVRTICKIDISYFPFDTQSCTMLFGSWTYTGSYLNLSLQRSAADLSGYTLSGEWDLVSTSAKRNVVKYSCCPDPYIDITYTFILQRKFLFYINNLIFPIVALAVLAMFGYYLPAESGERISLVITIMLGLTVYTLIFTENIPATSEVTPLLSRYSTAVMGELGISLIMSCLMLWIFHHDGSKEMPRWVEFVVFSVLAKIARLRYIPSKEAEPPATNGRKRGSNCMLMQAERWPVFYPMQRRSISGDSEPCKSPTCSSRELHVSPKLERKLENLISRMDEILKDNYEEQKLNEEKRKWQFAAKVIDHVVFWLYTLTVVFSTLALYLMIPDNTW
ncbi:neuronal acetylcholine receptor subunit alpha-10 [Nematostella vectensis]|uniref:neuronal acetylcholine receptor subunit alpha-10 n=1 Tax=Nematostella vectensis TaxID=45351 RepID=UPI0020770295|nr:neuronal acetylcholine receptor subunit alpha-10 [Nematostella vectensis]